jgi:ankyrin repeat protein
MEEVKALLKQGAYLNARDSDGDTALFVAAHFGHTDIVKLPAEKGAKDNPEKPAMEIVQKKIKEKK